MQENLESLVYIHYNLKVRDRVLRRNGFTYDPTILDNVLVENA